MRRIYRDMFLFLAGVICFQLCYSASQSLNRGVKRSSRIGSKEIEEQIDPECACKSKKTGKIHNFCYIDPQNKTSIGKKFDCSSLEHLENFGIFDFSQEFVDISKASRSEKEVVFVSASSDDHFKPTQSSFASIRKFYPNHKYILYNMGLTSSNRAIFEKHENVEVRDFDFSKFPKYTSQVYQYRWKALTISEVLKEYSNVWWVDAHLEIVKGEFTDTVYQERSDKKIESDVVMAHFSSHSNFAVMIPTVYNYIPTNSLSLMKSQDVGLQYGSGFLYIARTRQSLEIFKWYLLCALDETCFSPPSAQRFCHFGANRFDYFANCFRFDQSIINLLLLNEFQDYHKYGSSVEHHIKRV